MKLNECVQSTKDNNKTGQEDRNKDIKYKPYNNKNKWMDDLITN